MNIRRTIAVATATALLGSLGTYGAVTAFASSDAPSQPAASATASAEQDSKSTDDMIRQCVKHLPAKERKSAQKQMHSMMSGHHGMSDHNDMSDHSAMRGGTSAPMSSMMGTTASGS